MNPEGKSPEAIAWDFIIAGEQKANHPDGGDRHIARFGKAIAELVSEEQAVRDALEKIWRERRPMQNLSAYILDLMVRDINYSHLERDPQSGWIFKKDSHYPARMGTVDDWKDEAWHSLRLDDPLPHNENLSSREVQSNPYLRGRYLKFLAVSQRERVGRNPTFLDMGSSLNLVMKWLVRNNERQFYPGPVNIVNSVSVYAERDILIECRDSKLSKIINERYLAPVFTPGICIGLDSWPMDDPANELWVAACVYPKELEKKARLLAFNGLKKGIPEVKFRRAFCESYKSVSSVLRSREGAKFDFTNLSMQLRQNPEEDREAILKNAERYTDHFVVVYDAAVPDSDSPYGLTIEPWLYSEERPYNIRLLVKDMHDPDKGFQDIMRTKDGRFNDVKVNTENRMMQEAFDL